MAKLAFPEGYTFGGFEMPQYTPVPDVVFDYFLPRLNGSELKVLLYIIRRTLGFKKSRDDISLRQLVDGITTRDGRILDEGTGLSMPSVVSAVQSLVDKEIITAKRNSSPERGNEATTYELNFRGRGDDWSGFGGQGGDQGGGGDTGYAGDAGLGIGGGGEGVLSDDDGVIRAGADTSGGETVGRVETSSDDAKAERKAEGKTPSVLRTSSPVENGSAILTRRNAPRFSTASGEKTERSEAEGIPAASAGKPVGSAATSSGDENADENADRDVNNDAADSIAATSGAATGDVSAGKTTTPDQAKNGKAGETPYLNNLSRGTKETLVGGLKKLKTQETVVQETEQQEDVVALTQRGVYQKAAEKLVHTFPVERIREKVAIHDWLKRNTPRALSRNPAGWLVRAIEQDWPPPRRYQADRESTSTPEYMTAAERREAASAPGAVHSPKRKSAQPPDAPQQVVEWWDAAVEGLEHQLPRDTFNTWLRDAALVEGRQADGRVEVRIGVRNIYARDWLDTRLRKPVERELARVARREAAVTFAAQVREHFLRARRRELGMSQAALARRLKEDGVALSASSISAWERGVRVPQLDGAAIRALAGALDWGEARLRGAIGN